MMSLTPKYLYRFRPVANLLGIDRESELEGTYIYFASPEQLNDPLEGYRELVWKGDKIIWTNFFNHYIECIFIRNMQYLAGKFGERVFPLHPHFNEMPQEHATDIKNEIYKFTENQNIQRHIEYLSTNQHPIYSNELLLHLRSIQLFAMQIISKVLVKYDLIPEGYGINGESLDVLLSTSSKLMDQLEHRDAPERGLFFDQTMLAALQSIDLVNSYTDVMRGNSSEWLHLCNKSPEDFLNSRIRLTYPDWFVSCFMEDCSNSSIWGTYGNNHKGVCLKFKVREVVGTPTITLQVPTANKPVAKWWTQTNFVFQKVHYTKKSPELDFFLSLGSYTEKELISKWYTNIRGEKSNRINDIFGNLRKWREHYQSSDKLSLTTKTRHWKSEQEYRLIYKPNFGSNLSNQDRKLKYDFNDLEGIIFGISTPLAEKHKLMKMIEQLCKNLRRDDFTFYQAYYCHTDEKVLYRPVGHVSLSNGITPHSY
ncbi:DUF2971 domain-containing protein [Pseudomonas sp. P155]|uniref:DUF2971 domain-containing protein n=2 Tax=Pseudomonas neuropathica TaxID=2730425 RepID=A0ABS0BF30_9PSED|nr:DUF2971 domain-containing protein [Pseudomonas neuropathica]